MGIPLIHSVLNEKGFSLIGTMIGLAIGAIVALGVGSAFQLMNSSTNDLQSRNGSLSLTSALSQIISNQTSAAPTSCMQHLLQPTPKFNLAKARSAAGMPLGFSVDAQGNPIAGLEVFTPPPAGTPVPVPSYSVSVSSLNFKTSNTASVGIDPLTSGQLYLGFLVMTLLKMANTTQVVSGGNGLLPVTVGSLYVAVDSTDKIVNCYAMPLTSIDACTSLGGIYVASQNPPCELPYPCTHPMVFMGYNGMAPICENPAMVSILNCPQGHNVVSNGSYYVCN